MRVRDAIDSLVKLALLGGGVYFVWTWQTGGGDDASITAFAQSACIDAAESRHDVTRARVYEVTKNSNGFVVRVTGILPRGAPVKITCLSNASGGVTDTVIDER